MSAITRWKHEEDLAIDVSTSTTISSVLHQPGLSFGSIQFDANFEGTAATLEVNNGHGWGQMVDDAGNDVGAISITGGLAGETVQVPPEVLLAKQIRVVASTAQADDRTIRFVGFG